MIITSPTLLLNKQICENNIDKMLAKAKRANVRLRPHFKTHQSVTIGEWYRKKGVDRITVSSMKMANYFALDGWKDITVAIPVNVREIELINKLAKDICLNILVESIESIAIINHDLSQKINAYIKIDTGYHRAGIDAENYEHLDLILKQIEKSKNINFRGFLAHSGHNYDAADKEEILKNHAKSLIDLNELKDKYRKQYPNLELSLGDTPGCSISDEFYGIDEIRPGNFVFFDMMQYILGSCEETDIAVAMACPVIAKHAERNEIIINAGGVHFSKEYVEADDEGTKLYGSLVKIDEKGWGEIMGGGFLASLSQEHGIIRCNADLFNEIQIGELIGVLPVHSCMTANLMKQFLSTDGEIIEMMR